MKSHRVWINECHKIDFLPYSRRFKEGTKNSEHTEK